MNIQINKPYKIVDFKQKRYDAHYQISSSNAVVVPMRVLGAEVMCDIRWEDSNGELEVIHNAMFLIDNLVPLNSMIDDKLFELWSHYYGDTNKNSTALEPNQKSDDEQDK